jgi:hypothetical protein
MPQDFCMVNYAQFDLPHGCWRFSRGKFRGKYSPRQLSKFFCRIFAALCKSNTVLTAKDTLRSTVKLSFDGRVFKTYHGPDARRRFTNEVRVLKHLETRGCPLVPRLLEADEKIPRIITTNCGQRVEKLDDARRDELFAELETFGVHHDDPDVRNVTYRFSDGRFCLIDFEFATILPSKSE